MPTKKQHTKMLKTQFDLFGPYNSAKDMQENATPSDPGSTRFTGEEHGTIRYNKETDEIETRPNKNHSD
jgi:hypothetical protein